MTEQEALDLAKKVLDVFSGDLLDDGKVDEETVAEVVDMALEAARKELPSVVELPGVGTVPLPDSFVDLLVRGIESAVEAIIDATRPARVVVNNPGSVTGTIHE